MSQFGIIEMTRQRMRPSFKRSVYFDCPHCKGSGLVKTSESMSLDVMRKLAIAIADQRVQRVELTVCPEVAFYLLNRKRAQLSAMEERHRARVVVRQDQRLGLDEIHLDLFDSRDGLVYLDELGMSPFAQQGDEPRRRHQHGGQQVRGGQPSRHPQHQRGGGHGARQGQFQGRDRRHGGGGGPGGTERERERERDREREEDRFDLDRVEEAIDNRQDIRDRADESREIAPASSESDVNGAANAPLDLGEPSRAAASQVEDSNEDQTPEESHVIEVDEPHEPMGEGPRAFEESRRDGNGDGGGNGGGRRRRRRRGRRGRGRGHGQQQQQPFAPAGAKHQSGSHAPDLDESTSDSADDSSELASDMTEAATVDEAEEGAANAATAESGTDAGEQGTGRRRRRRRGGRRHRRRRDTAAAAGAEPGTPDEGEASADEDDQAVEPAPEAEAEPEPVSEAPATEESETEEPTKSRSRRSRGGRGGGGGSRRRGKTATTAAVAAEAGEAGPVRRTTTQRTPPQRTPPQRGASASSEPSSSSSASSPPPPAAAVAPPTSRRSGSTDRHLMHEDNVDTTHHEPPRRPHNYRDLDAIPDDFD
jgi:ribonuclease E